MSVFCRPCQFFVGCVNFIQIFCHMVRSLGINLNKTDTAYKKLTWPNVRPCQFSVGHVSFSCALL